MSWRLLKWSSHPWTGTLCGRANPENKKEQFRKKCPFYRITIPCEEWGFFQKADPWQPSQCCSPAPSASDRAPSNISHMIEIHFQICKSKIFQWFKTNKLWEKKPSQRKTQQGWLRPSGEVGHQTCVDPLQQLFFLSGNQQLCFWYFLWHSFHHFLSCLALSFSFYGQKRWLKG